MDKHTLRTEKVDLLGRSPLFLGISSADRDAILSAGDEKRLCRRQTIFSQGDAVRQMIILLSGCIKITQAGKGGEEVILRLIGMGEVVGGFQMLVNSRHFSTAQAVQPSAVLVWPLPIFERLVDGCEAFQRNVVCALEDQFRELECRFREVSTERVGSRLSHELIRLSKRFGQGCNGQTEVRLSRTELAQLTGTTLSTVSRLISRWQRLGAVSAGREGVQVRDHAALIQLSEASE